MVKSDLKKEMIYKILFNFVLDADLKELGIITDNNIKTNWRFPLKIHKWKLQDNLFIIESQSTPITQYLGIIEIKNVQDYDKKV